MLEQSKLKGNCKQCGKKNSDRFYPEACVNSSWINCVASEEEFTYGICKHEDMIKSKKIPGICKICGKKYAEHELPIFTSELGRVCQQS